MKGLVGSGSIQEVNNKTGTGSGGCGGRRCGPRIRILLNKMEILEAKRKGASATEDDPNLSMPSPDP
ncbi:MAG: hypothetical protein HYW48_04610 [Deltaproteobacteria bacterium]|nr:hypothetical protein [Deltaproteobacteria bacterium]